MFSHPGEFAEVVRWLTERSAENSLFLIIDRTERRVLHTAERILEDAGLSTLEVLEYQTYMDYDEEKSDLGDWLTDLAWMPKLKLNAFTILAEKGLPF